MTFSCGIPIALTKAVQASDAAPAPATTIRQSLIWRPVSSQALISPATAMIAVPCWSSCITGMFILSRSAASMMKHSGALMSSRLIPPKVGSISATALMKASGSSVSSSISIASTSAKRLNSTALPSITGLAASAPRLPMPRIAVPLVITATRLERAV